MSAFPPVFSTPPPPPANDDKGLEEYRLTLKPGTDRKVIVKCPPSMTTSELERVKNWLSFQVLIEDEKPQNQ